MVRLRGFSIRCGVSVVVALMLAVGVVQASPPPGKGPGGPAVPGAPPGNPAVRAGPPPHAGGPGPGVAATGALTTAVLVQAGVSASQARQWALALGLVGREALPPGIQRNLARGKPLPPGLARQALPRGYLERLPAYPGYEWLQVGTDLVLMATAGAVIADVLVDVFR